MGDDGGMMGREARPARRPRPQPMPPKVQRKLGLARPGGQKLPPMWRCKRT